MKKGSEDLNVCIYSNNILFEIYFMIRYYTQLKFVLIILDT